MSRKSTRIAAKPPKPIKIDDDDEGDEEEEEVVEKPKARKKPESKKGKEKAEDGDGDEEEDAEPKAKKSKKSADESNVDASNATVKLADLAESAKGSSKLRDILAIDPSSVTTTTTTTTATDSSGAKVTIKDLESAGFEAHFDRIATAILNHSVLFIAGLPHRVLELEFYFNGYKHIDDFAHCHERQKVSTKWYFHMTGSGYKGGSYKGLDVTFGDGVSYGGILLRSLQPLYGNFLPVEGPSLLVDHVLKTTGAAKIEDLVARFDISAETDLEKEDLANPKHPLFFVHSDKDIAGVPAHKVYKSARVGLSMKAWKEGKQNYVGKLYRYLVTPEKIKKGRHYLVASLAQQGLTSKQIVEATKCTAAFVEKTIALYNGGKGKNFKDYCMVNLSNDGVCEMVGSCAALCYPPLPAN